MLTSASISNSPVTLDDPKNMQGLSPPIKSVYTELFG